MDTLISKEGRVNEMVEKGEYKLALEYINNNLISNKLSDYQKKCLLYKKAKCYYLMKEYKKAFEISKYASKISDASDKILNVKIKVTTVPLSVFQTGVTCIMSKRYE
jgi:hypothetical protein